MILTYNIARKGTRMSHLRRISTAALALFLALTPAAAWAGPDQDKEWIVTGQHVDAPIPVWHDDTNSFSLNTINMPMEKTALWIPKAWTGTGEKDEAKSQLVIPAKRPDLAFLGAEGTVLNAAPQNPGPGNTPIWAGLGAGEIGDTDKFEGETYALDLISVDGPGRMEMFIDNGDSVNRFLSSHDTAYRSVYNPRHTHLYTTFTQPGRYTANFMVTARAADGTALYTSPITPLVWQVGGEDPKEGRIKDVRSAYSAARAERSDGSAALPSLTLAPYAGREHPGDEHLTEMSFSTGNPSDTGRVWLTVNGYFLTDLPVVNGTATWSEMLGSEGSQLQAVFTPDTSDANSAEASRWISHKLTYEPGKAESVYSDDGNGSWPEEIPDAANTVLSTQQYTPTSMDYDVTVTPNGNGFSTVEVRFKDPKVRGFLRGGFYAQDDPVYPYLDLEGSIEDGVARFTFRDESFYKGTALRVKMLTHPDMNASASTTEVAANYEPGTKYTAHGALAPDSAPIGDAPKPAPVDPAPSAEPTVAPSAEPSAEPSEAPSAEPTAEPSNVPSVSPSEVPTVPAVPTASAEPSAPAPAPSSPAPSAPAPSSPAPVNPTPSAPASTSPAPSAEPSTPGTPGNQCVPGKIDGRTKISHGHLDIQATLKDRQLSVGLRDDSGIIDADSTVRPLDSVVWTVSENARRVRTERMADAKLNFMAPPSTACRRPSRAACLGPATTRRTLTTRSCAALCACTWFRRSCLRVHASACSPSR